MLLLLLLPANRRYPVPCTVTAAAAETSTEGRKPFRGLMSHYVEHRPRLLHFARSVNKIIDEYLGTRSVIVFAHEVHRSELGQRLLADMHHPRLLVSAADLRPANGLIVYLPQGGDGGRSADYDAVLGRLPSSDHSRHMVLWDADDRANNDRVDLHRVQVTFEAFWQYQLIDVAVLVPVTSTGSIRVYAFNPYAGSRCNMAGPPIMINVWSGWTHAFIKPDRVFGLDNKLKDLHKYLYTHVYYIMLAELPGSVREQQLPGMRGVVIVKFNFYRTNAEIRNGLFAPPSEFCSRHFFRTTDYYVSYKFQNST